MAPTPDAHADAAAAISQWFRSQAARLATTDPDAPLDDLEPLRDVVGDGRVVAIREGAHFVAEFGELKARVVRFLVERCGFGVLALEFGVRDARALDPWLHGAGRDDDLVEIGGTLATAVHGAVLRWVRHQLTPTHRSVREVYMADSMRWHLDRLGPGARVVLVSHANHVQKTPIRYDGRLSAYPLGGYLADMLGADYRSIAITHTAATMPEMVYPDDTSDVGFRLTSAPLDEPPPGSVERGLADAGLAGHVTLTALHGAPAITSYRAQSYHQQTAVTEAFDAIISTPAATLDPTAGIPSDAR